MGGIPKVFISYSHDSDTHKQWIYKLACRLVENGIDTILDQWDLSLGSNLIKFMEHGLGNSDRVLIVCTDNYNNKSNNGVGGVGYEKTILTAELFLDQDTTKFIPCIRGVTAKLKTPVCLSGRSYIDFSDDTQFDNSFTSLLHELHGIPQHPKPKLGANPLRRPGEKMLPSTGQNSTTAFFSHRFTNAFPGVRGTTWFRSPIEAVKRIEIFFAIPFVFSDAQPIWWWRSGDMFIQRFSKLTEDTVLLDYQEITIDEMAAVNEGSYYQEFIYIKAKPSPPSGLYECTHIQDQVALRGYASEEFALFRGRPVTRAEYDDGAAVIDGSVIELSGEAQLRERFLTPYNFIIAAHENPINNNRFDEVRNELLNRLLRGEATIEELTSAVLKLPRREYYNRR